MKNYIEIFLVIFALQFFTPEYAFSQSDDIPRIESISGVLIEINETEQTVFIKSNSRVVKFYTTTTVCIEFKNNINSEVTITFTRRTSEGLQLITMAVTPKSDIDSVNDNPMDKK